MRARHAEDEVKMALSVLLLLSWLWPPLASARVLRGELDSLRDELDSHESWVYLTSFCATLDGWLHLSPHHSEVSGLGRN